MKTRNLIVISLASLMMSALAPAAAWGQNALGAGDALDHNLSPNSGGRNQPQRFENYRDRNLIINGDVVGGRGFRGAVGYAAPGDFHGALGSNDLFRFRAESALSSPQLFGLGRTFEQLQYGQSLGVVEYRPAGSADPAAINAENPVAISSAPSRVRLDRTTMALSSEFNLQSLAEPRVVGLMYNKDNQPLLFNASSVRGLTLEPMSQSVGTIGLSTMDAARIRADVEGGGVTPRLGAAFETPFDSSQLGLPKQNNAIGATPGAAAADRANNAIGAGGKNPPPNDHRANDHRIDSLAQSSKVNSSIQPDYGKILQRIADRYASRGEQANIQVSPELLDQLGQDYQTLRDQLTGNGNNTAPGDQSAPSARGTGGADNGRPTPGPGPGTTNDNRQPSSGMRGATGRSNTPGAAAGPGSKTNPRSPLGTTQTPGAGTGANQGVNRSGSRDNPAPGTPGAPGTPDSNGPDQPKPSEGLGIGLQRKPMTPEEFGVILRHGERIERFSNDSQDRFNELLSSAEQKLREGDYFLAERRFERALRFTPGHPLAMAGAAHAQLGAGLYLSAASSLRDLLSSQPEMIDVTYAPDLLPKRDRLDAAVAAIQDKITEGRDRASYALLLAYVGHQLGDRSMVEKGLNALNAAEPDNAFGTLLRSVWLAPPESKDAAPKPAAAPANAGPVEPGK